ncbi:MAG: acyl-CoA dehydrogenase family protein [Actinomycetota bacterium]|nr:acyl-CoA dehydrogenase family protein [Actinomycetota bacterium]
MGTAQPGRDDLAAWRDEMRSNFYNGSSNFRHVLERRAGRERVLALEPRLISFGSQVAGEIESAVAEVERYRDLPAIRPYDGIGQDISAIDFHPAHRRAGVAVWASGLLAVQANGEGAFEQAALFYLLSHVGEGGHACPVVCTAGLARALAHRGSQELRARYLPGLLSSDFDTALRGSQFLTEVQGGSDVGANVTQAVPVADPAGAWRLTGEKWFCSVADADLFAVTARPAGAPPGTRGLGCFLVPRTIESGRVNGFRLRRLKDKLGTRALASAEIEFDQALAWPIGPVEEGFHVAVEELLNTSRWLNAVGATGIMRRAYLEAAGYARHRRAFGARLGAFPIVAEQLAVMKVEECAALASTFALTELVDRLDRGTADEIEQGAHRILVNANKFVTSITATAVVHQAIEILGGNGTIEDFSPLPRLYRDAIVFESWEGTHNVLCAQIARDASRRGILDDLFAWARRELARAGEGAGREALIVDTSLDSLATELTDALARGAEGAAAFRRHLIRLVRAVQAACLLAEATDAASLHTGAYRLGAPSDGDKRAIASIFVRRHLVTGYEPGQDQDWRALIAAALGDDLGTASP